MKKPQSITKPKRKPSNSTVACADAAIYALGGIPVTLSIAQRWAKELEQWVKDTPEAKTITQFIRQKEITRSNFYDLLRRHECLKTAHENVMQELGERLWSNAVDKKADWKPVHHMLHTYSQDFAKADTYHANLKKEVEAIAGNYIVKMLQAQAPKDKE